MTVFAYFSLFLRIVPYLRARGINPMDYGHLPTLLSTFNKFQDSHESQEGTFWVNVAKIELI